MSDCARFSAEIRPIPGQIRIGVKDENSSYIMYMRVDLDLGLGWEAANQHAYAHASSDAGDSRGSRK